MLRKKIYYLQRPQSRIPLRKNSAKKRRVPSWLLMPPRQHREKKASEAAYTLAIFGASKGCKARAEALTSEKWKTIAREAISRSAVRAALPALTPGAAV